MSDPSSSASVKHFLTEEQIELERQRRQADWERVRTAADPVGNIDLLSRDDHFCSIFSRSTS